MEHKQKEENMNRQEIFKEHTTATFKLPNPFSAWPYFILIVATLLMGTTKLSSQSLDSKEASWENPSELAKYEVHNQHHTKKHFN